MPLTDQEIVSALPAMLALYTKIKASVGDPASLQVVPPVDPLDKADVALGIAQACNADFIALIRTVIRDVKD